MDEILDEKTYETRQLSYASFSQRSAAVIIDLLIFGMLSYGIYLVFGATADYGGFLLKYWWQLALIVTFYFIYFDGSEKNATCGKQVMNIRLLSEEKRDIDFTTSAKHLLLSILLFFGYFSLLSKDKHQTLTDKICRVFVINKS
ncbi:MAG: hypothetical protein JWN78_23 [Bacteroidota bacterium]|nr:hypothetical protein [Bacteroidota bacterium]